MNQSLLRTITQLPEFLNATPQVQFSSHSDDGDSQRFRHISAVLTRFDYPTAPRLRATWYGPPWYVPAVTAARSSLDW